MDRHSQSTALYFRPLVSLSAGRIIGFTAHGGIGNGLLHAACRTAAQWPDDFTLGVALAAAQWRDATLGLRVLSVLGDSGLAPARLELEITEAALDSDTDKIHRTIDELRTVGVMIALGGCGAGPGAALPPFCFDTIRLDPDLVWRLGYDKDCDRIADTLIALAEDRGLVTAADGISTGEQRDLLNAKGCAEGQGDLFGGAVTAQDIPSLLRFPSLADAVA
ncbi:MAG: EAL domain-containing protein [Pseudolabrys sp.]